MSSRNGLCCAVMQRLVASCLSLPVASGVIQNVHHTNSKKTLDGDFCTASDQHGFQRSIQGRKRKSSASSFRITGDRIPEIGIKKFPVTAAPVVFYSESVSKGCGDGFVYNQSCVVVNRNKKLKTNPYCMVMYISGHNRKYWKCCFSSLPFKFKSSLALRLTRYRCA